VLNGRLQRPEDHLNPGLDEINQLWIHKSILVGNVQHPYWPLADLGAELLQQLTSVTGLHHEDDVRPRHIRRSQASNCART
jgi:hypothetical protein